MNDSLMNIDPELLATNVNSAFKVMHKSVKYFKWAFQSYLHYVHYATVLCQRVTIMHVLPTE